MFRLTMRLITAMFNLNSQHPSTPSAAMTTIGDNLFSASDYGSNVPFLNVMKLARAWDNNPVLDVNGYPISFPNGPTLTYIMIDLPAEIEGIAGRWKLSWIGTGEMEVVGTITGVTSGTSGGRAWQEFDFDPATADAFISITISSATSGGEHIRDMILVKLDEESLLAEGQVFRPMWLEAVENSQILRFMDWQYTNGSTQQDWANRSFPAYYSWGTDRGVPAEIMARACNEIEADAWVCVPHLADDNYVTQLVTLLKNSLGSQRKLYLEYSNEVWNFAPGFTQSTWFVDQAEERWPGIGGESWMEYAGMRAAQVMNIASNIFLLQPTRLVRVAGVHPGWFGIETAFLEAPRYVAESGSNVAPVNSFDALATTGYFSGALVNEDDAETVRIVIDDSLAFAIDSADALSLTGTPRTDYIEAHKYDQAFDRMAAHVRGTVDLYENTESLVDLIETGWPHWRDRADDYGLKLLMYEGGTHILAQYPLGDDAELTALCEAFNYSQHIADIYNEVIQAWREIGDGPFMNYIDVAQPLQYGYWGARRWLGDENVRAQAIDSWRTVPLKGAAISFWSLTSGSGQFTISSMPEIAAPAVPTVTGGVGQINISA